MYKHFLIIFILLLPIGIKAQQKLHEIGVFAGVAYYMGDVNQQKLFYSPQPAFGFLYKIDINSRYAIRLNGAFAKLVGDDTDFDNGYQQTRNHNFNISLTEFSGLLEFNFLPYKPASQNEFFSPYITVGVGVMLMPSEEGKAPVHPVIPFGFGFKYALTKRIGIAGEWTYRITFTDYVDQLPQQEYTTTAAIQNKQRTFNSTNDWYSFAGITLTYKFALGSSKCPAYRN